MTAEGFYFVSTTKVVKLLRSDKIKWLPVISRSFFHGAVQVRGWAWLLKNA